MRNDIDIEIKNIHKEYSKYNNDLKRLISVIFPWTKLSKKVVLDDVSLTVKKGEKIALIGKNGSGKSTLLKIISGITVPNKGEITVNRKISILLEVSAGFNVEYTARENIYIRGVLLGLSKKQIAAIEDDIIKLAELSDDDLNQQLKRFSSGMIAKLGFAINVLCNHEILIIDEALVVGDISFRNKCHEAIKEISKKNDLTLIFVSHDEQMSKQFCNRGIFIDESKIIFDGNIDKAFEIYNKKYNNISDDESKTLIKNQKNIHEK